MIVLQDCYAAEKREVRQFQLTAWPDHGVPDHPTPLLLFMRRVKSMTPPECGPLVIHCRCARLSSYVTASRSLSVQYLLSIGIS